MSQHRGFCFTLLLLLVGMVEGCTTMPSGTSTVLPSSAFFPLDASELKPLQAIAHAQDARMKNCHKGPACEDAYYTRALVALFENRADAITVFQELRTAMPNSRYEVATVGWLNLLQDASLSSDHNKALMVQLKQEVLHNLLDRSEVATARPVKDHDRRVAELAR
ncbi:MAG: hypothetical protein KF711_02240 [Nitrospira sp.]|nr:hypothetical protein [Nitrospira sp.]MBX3369551.1 hypothetical protein [Nitrospira sp.]